MNQHTPMPPRSSSRASTRSSKSTKKRKIRWGRIVFILVSLVIISLASYAGYLYMVGKNNLHKIADQDPTAPPIPKDQKASVKPVSIVLLGLDYRKQLGSMNTDVIMVAAFNPISKTATVVSIPRDSDLKLEGYKKHKANAWYAIYDSIARNDNGLEGEAAKDYARDHTREMLGKFFGIDIDYTAVIDFQGFIDVVDALDGVRVNVDKDMRWVDKADGTNIDLVAGEQELDGEDALGFVRYRKSNRGTAPSSDFERNERQSQVLGAIIDKLKSFGSITKIDDVLNAVGDNMRTDIPESQLEAMIKKYFGIDSSAIRFIPLEGEWISPYVVLDQEKLTEAKQALREELLPEGRPAETPESTQGAESSSGN
ncbi:LCP family protein [Cohnella panacarvi]|uniref:LCP family protein n=1 Tax=Cohnella panacarvi TaxID=400776 RepID=UPI000685BB2D|nr:LCP family protein [Cohnella panacarvi]